MLNNAIDELDDSKAVRLLAMVARADGAGTMPDIADAERLLASTRSNEAECPGEGVTEGELARAALRWLAEDTRLRQAIDDMAARPTPERYGFEVGIGAVAIVLLLLKTRGVIEYKDGRWHFKLELADVKHGPLKTVLDLLARLSAKP